MRRDDDFIREFLIRQEDDEHWSFFAHSSKDLSDDEKKAKYHILLMEDAGLVRPISNREGSLYRMTAAGHDLVDAIRQESIWKRTKEAVAETGGSATLEIVRELAVGFLKKKITEHTGVDL